MFNDSLLLKLTSLVSFTARVRRFFIIHTAEQLPFGPFKGGIPGGACSRQELELLQGLDGIWAVSKTIQEYALFHGGLETQFLSHHPWNYLVGDNYKLPQRRQNWGVGKVLMVNPCPVKGSDILFGVALRCPDLDFLVLRSWGIESNPDVAKALAEIQNIESVRLCNITHIF
jgi:hypothetical protein